ncbi:hypothetical protein AKJ09_11435 [Labilithrix luteola]|uniref:Outer membrane lipoprotein BamD-like domain-containing protein n=1 Tax=Labilithrix luteola TaxID=1391654 RepID=A0A0K1QGJ7_9BACT|nr:hypothetical protein AKJ09_11435 [Labilithrix luteola]
MADRVEAVQASADSTSSQSIVRSLVRPRAALVVITAAAFGVFATTQIFLAPQSPSSSQTTAPIAAPAVPAHTPEPVATPASNPVAEMPTIDVRSLPSSTPSGDLRRPSASVEAPIAEESESSLLNRAHAAVTSNPQHALALTSEHARRFANGMLVQEREVIAIEALARLGRVDEARARAATFYSNYPNSAYRRRVDAAFGNPNRTPSEAR